MQYPKMVYKTFIYLLVFHLCKKSIRASQIGQAEASGGGPKIPPVQKTLSSSDMHLFTETQLHAFDSCSYDDFPCLSMAASDKHGLEAIVTLHKQLDDDADGNIDFSESDDFLKEELKYNSGSEKRQKAFHKDNDMHISVKELWEAWLKSEVHNWTIEQTTEWLVNNVHLPQYVPNFLLNKVKGANLPRLAVNNGNYLGILGIKDPIHRQKISLKAMDVVLFGPPKDGITWKDVTLVLSGVVVLLGGWLAYQQNKKFKNHLNRMNRDMDSLQTSEQALEKLQKQLEEAKQSEVAAISEKQNLERLLQDSRGDMASLTSAYSESDITHYKEEIKSLKAQIGELTQAAFKNTCYGVPPGLQQWLQLTYELEQKSFDKKKVSAEKQLQQAREACEKLRKKRSSLVGAFVSTHGKSIDDVDRSIVEARSALNEVTYELQERTHRWRQIELLCGFSITNNIGLQTLESVLYKKQERLNGFGVRMNSMDDLDVNDDNGSVYGLVGSYPELPIQHMASLNEDETSGSENGKQDENANESKNQDFSFQIGGTSFPEDLLPKLPSVSPTSNHSKSASQSNISVKPTTKTFARSLTQDINLDEFLKPKASASEGTLDATKRPSATQEVHVLPKKAISIEDDVCSTDSSLIEDIEVKKKKRKLFNFSKRSKKGEKS